MFASDIIIDIRNILIIQMVMIFAVPADAFRVCKELMKIWKALITPVELPKQKALSNKKKGSFWEVDMTKFEP